MPRAVIAQDLCKRFEAFEAVRGICFAIERGECFGFLGPNGAGKTSTMRMMGCISPISGGTLQVLDRDATRDAREIKRRLGVVPQEDNLDQYLTARENLLLYGRYFDLGGPALRARATEVLHLMQLHERGDDEVNALSGGMKRRLAIARALVSGPELVILDEPTTGLDPQARHLLWERLRTLKDDHGSTLVLSTHYMDEAEQLCDRLVVMEGGRIIAEGAPHRLIEQHVAREVLEIVAPAAVRERARALLAGRVEGLEMLQDRLLVFAPHADALMPEAMSQFGAEARILARRSSLEDVYLKLTGRSLRED